MPHLLVPLLALALAACDPFSGAASTSTEPDLGDPYTVASRPLPFVSVHGVLELNVSYGGGCEEHTFDLGIDDQDDRADLWLTHDANGDLCEAYIQESLSVPVPESVLSKTLRLYISETETISVPVPIVEEG